MEDTLRLESRWGNWHETEFCGDTLAEYLHEIARVPLLTAAEELRLSRVIRRGDVALQNLQRRELSHTKETILWRMVLEGQQAERHMAEANLRLVVSVAKRFANRGMPFVDLIQEGNMGLLRAVRKYDYRMHYRFSTYATCWIRQAMGRAIAEQGRAVRLPAYMAEWLSLLRNTSVRLQQALGREPTVEELTLETGTLSQDERDRIRSCARDHKPLPPNLNKRLIRARARVQTLLASMLEPLSLECPLGEDDKTSLQDLLYSHQAPSPADETLARIQGESLIATLGGLSPREQVVLRHRFGLDDADVMTLEEIGQSLGVTRERVRQIEERALRKLRVDVLADNWSLA
jgi:RNA polymerase primary sigma factor